MIHGVGVAGVPTVDDVSPSSRYSDRASMVDSVISPEGTMTQTARGGSSLLTRSSREFVLVALAAQLGHARDRVGVHVEDDDVVPTST